MEQYIYHYNPITKAFTNKTLAEADPEETRIQEKFVPLVPAYATIKEVPEVSDGQVAVFENNDWVVKVDYRNYFLVDNNLMVTEIKTIDKPEGIVIDKELGEKVKANPDDYKIENDAVVPKTEDDKKKEEHDRIQELFITRSDFFDATIKAFGADGDDLLLVINKLLPTLQIDEVNKKIALNNFKNAQNFYRKHTLFTLLSDVDIPIAESKTIRITSEQWDNFFDKATNEETKADAYKELLPREE